jgi:hypothetical protein
MIVVEGQLYPAGSARRMQARLTLIDGGRVRIETGSRADTYLLTEVEVSDPLGGLPRTITFPDLSKFECEDSEQISDWLQRHGCQTGSGFIHRLERHWKSVAAALVVTVAVVVALFVWGIPASSGFLARFVPREARVLVGQQTEDIILGLLDDESELDAEEIDAVREIFDDLVGIVDDPGVELKLFIRGGGGIGANALAVPNGTIVITDEMIDLCPSRDAIAGILAHEVGHLVHRHGMQRAIEAASLPVLLALLTGDLAAGSTLLGTIPMSLVQNGYSREHEREADAFARDLLLDQGMDLEPVAVLFEALRDQGEYDLGWWSTHPPTDDRIRFFREAKLGE